MNTDIDTEDFDWFTATREMERSMTVIAVGLSVPDLIIDGTPFAYRFHNYASTKDLEDEAFKAFIIKSTRENALSMAEAYLMEKAGYSEEAAAEAVKQAAVKVDVVDLSR